MNIFQMNFSASILIILIVLLRSVAHHKLPKGTFLILWEIAAIRLLVPFSVPIRFRYFTGLDKLNGLLTESTDVRPPNITTVIAEKITDNAMPISVIKIVWLVGLCAGLLFFVISHIKNCREFRTSLPVENDFATRWLREHSLRRPIQVRQIDRIKAPLTYGIFRPIILLPKNMEWTDEKQINFIFEHEYVHIRRFDTLRKMILSILLCAHWFNPLVWLMCILANRDIEMSCDEQVIRRLVKADRTEYARTLIDMEERKSGFSVVCNHFCKNATEERIEYIMKYKKASAVSTLLALVLVFSATSVFAKSSENNLSTGILTIANSGISTEEHIASAKKLVYEENGQTLLLNENNTYTAEEFEKILEKATTGQMRWEDSDETLIYPASISLSLNADGTINSSTSGTIQIKYVSHNDERKFSAKVWKKILEKIENGEIFWED